MSAGRFSPVGSVGTFFFLPAVCVYACARACGWVYLRLEVSMRDEVEVQILQPGHDVRKVAGRQRRLQAAACSTCEQRLGKESVSR